MSQKQAKRGSPERKAAATTAAAAAGATAAASAAAPRIGGGRKSDGAREKTTETDANYNENVVRKLYDCFKDIFDYDLVASVCHTCQWDASRATEALMVLGDAAYVNRRRNSKSSKGDVTKNKPKSLPSTLKPNKSDDGRGSNSLYAMPNSLRSNPAHMSTSSLSSGQVWQRHYKSKPQSPGLLTMIPPYTKESSKLKKTGSARSLPTQSPAPTKPKETPEVKTANAIVKRIQHLVQNGVKVLILMRGAPGSGKTHLAQSVVSLVIHGSDFSQHIFSTDDYFIMLGRGSYAYDSHQLPLAHNWNQRRVCEALRRATNPVVVDNTNIQAWEMEPYVWMAVSQGYLIEILEPVTPWRTSEAELTKRNIHAVPREKIRQMLEKYERGWTGEKLIQLFGLNYVPCGSAHVSQELTTYSNSPLAQHRQHAVIDTPEKPKRKKNDPKKKDRRNLAGIEITEDKEKQLEELNQLFAEYGKEIDPVSKKKVLESGVPISEVVSRMRKLQGNILPLPESNAYPDTIPQRMPRSNGPQEYALPRESPSESVEPDTMSSSNASETSECESDTEAEANAEQLAGMKNYFNYRCGQDFVDGRDIWEEYSSSVAEESAAKAAKKGKTEESCKSRSGVTSSQEELSLIDFEYSTNPACSSQEELSLLDYEDGEENKNGREESSSSSEEQETQLLTLQESLREALIDNLEKRIATMGDKSGEGATKVPETEDLTSDTRDPGISQTEATDNLMNAVSKKIESIKLSEGEGTTEERVLVDYLLSNSQEGPGGTLRSKKSPDLEEIPLPSIPPGFEAGKDAPDGVRGWGPSKRQTFDDIVKTWEYPANGDPKTELQPKPGRQRAERPKGSLLGAVKKTGIQRDQSPEELLKSVELSWSSIPFTSSWENINRKEAKDAGRQQPKPQRRPVSKADSSTNTKYSDFDLWKDESGDVVKLTTQNRNINENLSADAAYHVTEYPMLDKGSMTSDTEEGMAMPLEVSLELLTGMFPDIEADNLVDILEKCKGDIHWAVELLLDSPHNTEVPAERKPSRDGLTATETNAIPLENFIISDGKKTIKRRKDRRTLASGELRKQIEDGAPRAGSQEPPPTERASSEKKPEESVEAPPEGSAAVPEAGSDACQSQSVNGAQEEEEEEEECIPMKIDPNFFQELAKHYGHSVDFGLDEGHHCISVINIPISLGHQIYSCWLESVNRQIEEMQAIYDNMIKEDELLAKALQEQQRDQHKPDLREIMDMELAMALYKQDEEQYRGSNRETLACKLSKQLLFEEYPNINRNVLVELFRDQDNSYQKTVDVLNCQKGESPKTVIAPEFLASYKHKLIEQANMESAKKATEGPRKPIIIVKQQSSSCKKSSSDAAGDSRDVLVVNPAEFRQKMTLLQRRRNDCCRQAQEAFRKKSYSVASYYSHIASLYKERIAEMNERSMSLQLFDEKRTEMSTKLDLHFLFIPEALQVVDMFIDRHIEDLNRRNLNCVELSLITGRGLRSRLKKAKIKPAIKKRLDQRKLNYVEQNPGMIRVTVYKTDYPSERL